MSKKIEAQLNQGPAPEKERVSIRLNNVKLKWAYLHAPSEMSNKYQVDIYDIHVADLDKLIEAGISVKNGEQKQKPDREVGNYITGSSQKPVNVVDSKLRGLTPEEVKTIGNGTVANVVIRPYEWEFKNKSGVGCGLQAVQIVVLKAFTGMVDNPFTEVAGGYSTENPF